jgi:hypothetical protein
MTPYDLDVWGWRLRSCRSDRRAGRFPRGAKSGLF